MAPLPGDDGGTASPRPERRKADRTLAETEERYQQSQILLGALVDSTPDLIWSVGATEFELLTFNRSLEQYFREEFGVELRRGVRPSDYADPARAATWEGLYRRALAEGTFALEYGTYSGGRVLDLRFSTLRHGPEPFAISVFGRDVTAHKRAEAALRAEKEFSSNLVQHSPVYIVAIGTDGRIALMNDSMLAALGYAREEVVGRPYLETFVPEADRPAVAEVFGRISSSPAVTVSANRVRTRDGKDLLCEWRGIPVFKDGAVDFLLGVGIDIGERTRAELERQQLQAQLQQAQKLEYLGRLAGGVAHDFNNLLSVILGETEILREEGASGAVAEGLQVIQQTAERSAELTRQLLAFARQQATAPRVVELNGAIEGLLKMVRRLLGEGIELRWRPGAGLKPVLIDPSQLDQLLANLCVNARDAIATVGTVTVETANVTFDDALSADYLGCVPGDYVMISVSDNGCGMTREVRERIFEPFFSTKSAGKGTGLGLATVYGIVKQSEGTINVYSEPGKGTTFRIYLHPTAEPSAGAEEAPLASGLSGRGETVLLVEDDESLLRIGRTMLERMGFRVLSASTPARALEVAAAHGGAIDLLLTDVILPEMSGRELHQRLGKVRPGLKCLYVSGYTADIIAHHGVLEVGVSFLAKPYSMRSLAAKVGEVLGLAPGGREPR